MNTGKCFSATSESFKVIDVVNNINTLIKYIQNRGWVAQNTDNQAKKSIGTITYTLENNHIAVVKMYFETNFEKMTYTNKHCVYWYLSNAPPTELLWQLNINNSAAGKVVQRASD